MMDAFFKALRWFVFVAFVIGGIAGMAAVERQGLRPLFFGVLSFGGAYIMSGPWRNLPKEAMVVSVLLIAALAALAHFLPTIVYLSLGQSMNLDFFLVWAGLMFALGVPFMTVIFSKYDE